MGGFGRFGACAGPRPGRIQESGINIRRGGARRPVEAANDDRIDGNVHVPSLYMYVRYLGTCLLTVWCGMGRCSGRL
jgi:hypothetical protein